MKFSTREAGEWANVLLEKGCFQSEGYWDWKKKKKKQKWAKGVRTMRELKSKRIFRKGRNRQKEEERKIDCKWVGKESTPGNSKKENEMEAIHTNDVDVMVSLTSSHFVSAWEQFFLFLLLYSSLDSSFAA